jgi:vancomycin resistance protein YoaR
VGSWLSPGGSPLSRRTIWLIATGFIVVAWVLSGFVVRALNSGEVLGGTSMGGVDLGGQTRVGAAELIDGIPPRRVTLRTAEESFRVRAPQAGLVVDVGGSAEKAYSAGRSGVGAVLKGPLVLFGDREVEPLYEPVNPKRLTRTVNRIADQIDREPFNGALSVDRDTLEVSAELPKPGVRVRRGATEAMLVETLEGGGGSMTVPVRSQKAPSPAEVQAVAKDAELYLQLPLRIITASGPGSFSPSQVAGLLTVETTGKAPDAGIRLGADPDQTERLVADFAETRDRPAKDASLDTPPLPPVNLSEQGDLTWTPKPNAATVRQARAGRQILQGKAVENVTRAIRNGPHLVRFPSERVEPDVSANELNDATSLLGTFTTSFSCCEPRVKNIQQMARTVDGTVIGPGEQFSLNGIAGERTIANGYKPAPTIGEGNKLIDTVGGGVSQFSTTTYNAAYFAGLQIDLHVPHSFYIDRYPAGREATLNFGSIDLLWTNDTKTPVVVRSSASDTAVTVSIYGGNGGRRVKAETQSRRGNSQGGFDITIDRVVISPDGTRSREPYTTVYGLPAE